MRIVILIFGCLIAAHACGKENDESFVVSDQSAEVLEASEEPVGPQENFDRGASSTVPTSADPEVITCMPGCAIDVKIDADIP